MPHGWRVANLMYVCVVCVLPVGEVGGRLQTARLFTRMVVLCVSVAGYCEQERACGGTPIYAASVNYVDIEVFAVMTHIGDSR